MHFTSAKYDKICRFTGWLGYVDFRKSIDIFWSRALVMYTSPCHHGPLGPQEPAGIGKDLDLSTGFPGCSIWKIAKAKVKCNIDVCILHIYIYTRSMGGQCFDNMQWLFWQPTCCGNIEEHRRYSKNISFIISIYTLWSIYKLTTRCIFRPLLAHCSHFERSPLERLAGSQLRVENHTVLLRLPVVWPVGSIHIHQGVPQISNGNKTLGSTLHSTDWFIGIWWNLGSNYNCLLSQSYLLIPFL